MTDLAEVAFRVDSRSVGAGVKDVKAFGDESARTAQKVNRSETVTRGALIGVGSAAENMGERVGMAASRGFARAEAAADSFGASARRAVNINTAPVVQAGRGFSRMGSAVQNASYQLQDITVQIQGGVQASRALAQQLPQLLGGFGALGAVLGLTTGLSIPFIARLGDMGAVSAAAGESLGRLAGILPSLADASGAITSALTAVADNLDRLIVYAGTAAALFAGKYVAGLAAAAVATGSLSGALVVLRGALIRTGFGALIIGAGELVYQFVRLVKATGAFGSAMGMLTDVAREVWDKIPSIVEAAGNILHGIGFRILANFQAIFASILRGAQNMVSGIAEMMNSFVNGMFKDILTASDDAPEFAKTFVNKVNGAFSQIKPDPITIDLESSEDFLRNLDKHADLNADTAKMFGDYGKDQLVKVGESLDSVQKMREAISGSTDEAVKFGSAAEGAAEKVTKGAKAAGEANKIAKKGAEERIRLENELLELQGNTAELQRRELAALDPGNRALQKMIYSAREAQEALEPIIGVVDGMAGAFGDFVSRGLTDFGNFAESILKSFQNLLSQMIATAARNKIMIALGMGGVGGGGAAVAAAPGGVGSSIAGALTGAAGAFTGGLSSVVGGIASGGLSGGLGAIGTALGGATSGLTGLATAAGAIALPVAGLVAAFSFFRSKTKELDRGLRITADGASSLVEEFKKVEKSRFWGLSKSRKTGYDDADQETSGPIQKAYREIYTSVEGMARSLGIGSSAIEGFSQEVKISLKGLSDAEAQTKIKQAFAEMSDSLAETALASRNYVREGETATDALTRLSSSLSIANGALRTLGLALFEVGLRGADAASAFVDQVGGAQRFAEVTELYFQNFYSLGERAREAEKQFRVAVRSIGDGLVSLPRTEAGFRATVDQLMRRGQKQAAAALLNLTPLFVESQRLQTEIAERGERRRIAIAQKAEGRARAIAQKADRRARAMEQAEEDRERRAERIADERGGLERQLLALQGNTAEIRRRELMALTPANRALQRMVWGLEDAKDAMDALNPQDFASLFDFQKASAFARRGAVSPANSTAPIYNAQAPTTAVTDETVVELRRVRAEIARMREQQRQLGLGVHASTKGTHNLLRRFDVEGMPAVRA